MAAALKRENMERTAAQVRRIMVASSGDAPSERTLQRHFAREDLATPRGSTVFGRFEAEAPNVLWTGDVLHGPLIGGKKTYLVAFLDDHSRFITGHRWGWSEDSLHLAVAFKRAVAARGLPGTAYVDNGACFVDETIAVTCAKLGIRITHSPPYRPEGRGKIERFFETVRGQFLVEISPDGKPAPGRRVPDGLEQLNGWFTTWVEHEYHVRVALLDRGGAAGPVERGHAPVHPAPRSWMPRSCGRPSGPWPPAPPRSSSRATSMRPRRSWPARR